MFYKEKPLLCYYVDYLEQRIFFDGYNLQNMEKLNGISTGQILPFL